MDNASKALLMAGSVLIAVLIMGLVVYMFNTSSQWNRTSEDVKEVEQITAFNKQYESYNRKLLRGTDVVSVINKVLDNNEKYGINGYNESKYLMEVKFELIETLDNLEVGKIYGIAEYNAIKGKKEAFTEFKRKVFNCTDVEYSKETGRVKKMIFVEQKVNYTE